MPVAVALVVGGEGVLAVNRSHGPEISNPMREISNLMRVCCRPQTGGWWGRVGPAEGGRGGGSAKV